MSGRLSDRNARRRAERGGRLAEWLAAMSMRLKGYSIVKTRFRSGTGEIDLIARRGRLLAFVEVKTRRNFETAIEAVTPQTRRRIGAAAQYFLSKHQHLADCAVRYDIIAIAGWRIRHLRDAWRDGGV
ncbi:YraN family protein [Hyphococcus sp.]|uniref:YraN family protein n=1 Tax=Hyphococcus sp. TaxID=2038636 RepID=UPI003CCB850A